LSKGPFEERIRDLEHTIGDKKTFKDLETKSVTQKLQEIGEKWGSLEDKNLQDFFSLYTNLAPLLEEDTDVQQLLLSSEMKAYCLIGSLPEYQKTANSLEIIQTLNSVIESPPIPDLVSFTKRLETLETKLQGQIREAHQIHQQVITICDQYNTTINLMSHTVLKWDEVLTSWEQLIDQELNKLNLN